MPSIRPQMKAICASKFGQTLPPFIAKSGHLPANHRPSLAPKPAPRRMRPSPALPRPSHRRKRRPRAKECGGRILCSHYNFLKLHFSPQISSILFLALSKTPLTYPIIPLRPSRFVLLISPSKLPKNYRLDLPLAILENYT